MGRQHLAIALAVWSAVLAAPRHASAQDDRPRFDAGGQVAAASWRQFDGSDFGIGGRFAWHPAAVLGIEAELNLYPGDFPEGRAFSSGRVEGLFGVTAGPRVGRARLFGRLRGGFLRVDGARQPLVCILIFPPPLSCTLAAGRTLPLLDAGGGVEVAVSGRTFIRVDAGDRMLRYPGPATTVDGVRQDSFLGHDFRFAAGAGVRF